MGLKGELDELMNFNERSEKEIKKIQLDNDLLKKAVKKIQNQIVALETIKAKAIEKNKELQDT